MAEIGAFDDIETDENEIREEIVSETSIPSEGRGRLIPFSYYGGKYQHLHWLLPLLPERKAYVEPFGGSGVVLLNREPSDIETFNDIYDEVTNFFRVCRDNPKELAQKIALTPYSETEFEMALQRDESLSMLEQARRFFVVVNMSFNCDISSPSWSYSRKYSARGVPKKVSAFQAKVRRIGEIADRLIDTQITNRDAIDVIETFDTEDALIYCDPPYPPTARESSDNYIFEMDESDHREVAEALRHCDADVAVSSYRNELYDEIFIEHEWGAFDAEANKLGASETAVGEDATERTETVYVNYEVTDEMLAEAFD